MTMKDWSRHIGETHRRRDRATTLGEQKVMDREHQRDAECLQRWPAIVAAMRTVVAGYNHKVGSEALTLVEDAVNHGVTLESVANGRRALVMALDGSDVSVRTHNKNGDSTSRYSGEPQSNGRECGGLPPERLDGAALSWRREIHPPGVS